MVDQTGQTPTILPVCGKVVYVGVGHNAVEPSELGGLAASDMVMYDEVVDEGKGHFVGTTDDLQRICVHVHVYV